MKKNNTVLITVLLCLCLVFSFFPHTLAAENTIQIANAADLAALAAQCRLDTQSAGKTVRLVCDISLEGMDFPCIPIFCGTFDGGGHKISGLQIESAGSEKGLFRYITESGVVKNTDVYGDIHPTGSASFIGGIVGDNRGTVSDCRFYGSISGDTNVGGIAGICRSSGRILSCHSEGTVTGNKGVGGIAGENAGLVSRCGNKAQINTVKTETGISPEALDTDAQDILENWELHQGENEDGILSAPTDIGGIIGINDGITESCQNSGSVGYPHVGYNIGGIAGRQSGYITGCENSGTVFGRKDVGGIVGQAEPYILLHMTDTSLATLKTDVNTLHDMLNTLADSVAATRSTTGMHLDNLSSFSAQARESAQTLADTGMDFADDKLGELNGRMVSLSSTLKQLEDAFKTSETVYTEISTALETLGNAMSDISATVPDTDSDTKEIQNALQTLSDAGKSLSAAVAHARLAIRQANDIVDFRQPKQLKPALEKLAAALADISRAKNTMADAVENLEEILADKPDSLSAIIENAASVRSSLAALKTGLKKSVIAIDKLQNILSYLAQNTLLDFDALEKAGDRAEDGLRDLSDSFNLLQEGLDTLSSAFSSLQSTLSDSTKQAAAQINQTADALRASTQALGRAADTVHGMLSSMQTIVSDFTDDAPVALTLPKEDFKNASDDLFHSLTDISGEMTQLRRSLSERGQEIDANIRKVNDQIQKILSAMLDTLADTGQNASAASLSDLIEDVSETTLSDARQGKVKDCQNHAAVEADRNAGGIAGSMAIDFASDPEDDIERPSGLHFTYQTHAILQSCVNDGTVSGQKDCVGGVTGYMHLGTVFTCENYGNVQSGGDYIGGVAGYCASAIRKSCTKCRVEGARYVGGIAGRAASVSDCCAIVHASGKETVGDILGVREEQDTAKNNVFVAREGSGGIDGISYADIAAPVSYETLCARDDIPVRLLSFTVRFAADGRDVSVQSIKYGDPVSRIRLPDVPEKDGYFGVWENMEAAVVTEDITLSAVYTPYIKAVSSVETNENDIALGLVQGLFTDQAILHITDSDIPAPQLQKPGEKLVVWDVRLSGTELTVADSSPLRLINAKKSKVRAWKYENGVWQSVKVKYRGKYIEMPMYGTEESICLLYIPKKAIGLFVLLALLLLILLVLLLFSKQLFKKSGKHKQ